MSALPWKLFPWRQAGPASRAVSLCVDFAMCCQGSGACWAGWHGVRQADKNPHCIPATSSSQHGPWSSQEGGATALNGGRRHTPAKDPCLAIALWHFLVLYPGPTNSETSGFCEKGKSGPITDLLGRGWEEPWLNQVPKEIRVCSSSENHHSGENECIEHLDMSGPFA